MINDFEVVDRVLTEKFGDIVIKNSTFYTFGLSGMQKKGVSEKYFFPYLKNAFGNLVIDSFNMKIKIYPDFIIIDEFYKLKIAIEIDEPYSFENRKPIHLKDSHNYKHSIYSNNGWFVIRFTEEQIVKFSQKCCEEISFLRTKIIAKDNLTNLLATKDSSIAVKEWGEIESRYFEMNKVREKYLREYNIQF